MDTSIHDWLEGRGESMVLTAMIDEASALSRCWYLPAFSREGFRVYST